jgi:DNA-directed RNA polymerase subunit M/transcription elongation factor TFIIS
LESKSEEKSKEALHLLSDPRFERLLIVARQMNDLRARIRAATDYIMNSEDKKDVGEVEFAREELVRTLDKNFDEASKLMPVIEEIVAKYQEQLHTLHKARKLNMGLAKIESLSGAGSRSRDLEEVALTETAQIVQIENLVSALDALEKDLTTRRKESVSCPRCNSRNITYRIVPTEMGFSLYKCNECSNNWRITQYTLKI